MKIPPVFKKARASTGRQSSEVLVAAAPAATSHASVAIRVHNRTSLDLLAVPVVAALASSSTVTSSSINTYTTNVPTRNTPVPVPPRAATDLPQTDLEPSTAASSKGYEIELTILARGAPASTALSATISAIPPTSSPAAAPSTGRRWKKLDLAQTSNASGEKAGLSTVSALQSIPSSAADTIHILVLPTRDTASWMSALPDTQPLSALCIPGTHESCALYGWPISACQESSSSVAEQLQKGVRFLDIRLALKSNVLYAYHGVQDEKMAFSTVLEQTYAFLAAQPRETVIMSVKQENAVPGFEQAVMSGCVAPAADKWYTGTRVPTLGEARGKIVLFSRFGSSADQPGGIHAVIWPDSSPTPFTYDLPDSPDGKGAKQSVITQDWYNISSLSAIPTKISLINTLIAQAGSQRDVLGLNFTSASSFPLALPPFAAKGMGDQTAPAKHCWQVTGINALLVDLIADKLQAGTALMTIFALDFFDQPGLGADLTRLLIEANY